MTGVAAIGDGDDEVRLFARDGQIVGGAARKALPSVLDLAVEQGLLKVTDRDVARSTPDAVATLVAWGALSAEAVATLEITALGTGLARTLGGHGPWTLQIEARALAAGEARPAVQSPLFDFLRRTLATASSESALRSLLDYEPSTRLLLGDEPKRPLPEPEAAALAHCKERLPASLDALLPDAAAGARGRLETLAGLAALEAAGLLRREGGDKGDVSMAMPTGVTYRTLLERIERVDRKLAIAMPWTDTLDTSPDMSPEASAAQARMAAAMLSAVGGGDGSGPKSPTGTGSSWRPETFDAYATKRAAAMNLDLTKQSNVDAIEHEYLEKMLDTGMNNAAWAEVLPLAERALKKNAKNPQAFAASSLARWHLRPGERTQIFDEVATASNDFRKSSLVQHAFAEIAYQQGSIEAFNLALRRFSESVPSSDRRLRILRDRKHQLQTVLKPNPVLAVGAFLLSAVVIYGVSLTLGGAAEPIHHPLDGKWMTRHALLLVVSIAMLAAGAVGGGHKLLSVFKSVSIGDSVLAFGAHAVLAIVGVYYFGQPDPPAVFILPLALVTVFTHVFIERLFFNAALQESLAVDDNGRLGLILSPILYGLFKLSYVDAWTLNPMNQLSWIAITTLFVGVPCAVLWHRSRSIWSAVAWQMGGAAVEIIFLGH
ncbi:MAG: CPBP family intramembrane metalloprotease [Deltaproteobacteria bacterium]|nr:CPBP family intramembrane metalloprotease [Deltaproteobacteria bacterium]